MSSVFALPPGGVYLQELHFVTHYYDSIKLWPRPTWPHFRYPHTHLEEWLDPRGELLSRSLNAGLGRLLSLDSELTLFKDYGIEEAIAIEIILTTHEHMALYCRPWYDAIPPTQRHEYYVYAAPTEHGHLGYLHRRQTQLFDHDHHRHHPRLNALLDRQTLLPESFR